MQAILEQFRARIRGAAAERTTLRLRGGGSKDWYGQTPAGALLETRAYSGIIDYEPTELVITARCGTPLAEIEAALAAQRQMLAFEPPHFGPHATLGGTLACALGGPRRATAGAARDFTLGAVLMDGKGERLAFGGQVMKNVAGYDVSRLLAGSLGTLGLILEASLKVLPLPPCEASLRFEASEIDALRMLNEWAGRPLPISASCWHAGALTLRLSGAEAAVAAARRSLGGETLEAAAPFWAGLREQTHPFFAGAGALWRLSLPPAASAIILKGAQLIEWGGAQRWLRAAADAATAGDIRRSVAAAGGHASLFRGGDKSVGVFHPLAPAVALVQRRLTQAFDPDGIFNPGRMY
ncbi:glycolate oxidase subunit GlcE [Janthinobacterium sp.]|uniref:glycolate oxidase subunit GlcE n=1 Tax=Janthinobacterium sp. TaxID=1871054 RepID=UPI00293D4801|nr:glycolate oxidase subunit GlcE [Janthinobacterium sp.]